MRLAKPSAHGLSVALTLDACTGAFDRRIADVLLANRIPATILVTGRWLRHDRDGLAFLLAHRDLFAMENHGDRHTPPVLGGRSWFGLPGAADLDAVRREVSLGAADIRAAGGGRPAWYRAATGYYTPDALSAIRAMGVFIAAYSLNGDQGASLPAETVAAKIAAAVDGDIIVSHINQPGRPSGAGVAQGVLALKARGARFLRLDHLALSDVRYYWA